MAGLEKRVSKVEEVLEQHLIESGEIRGDLKWLKKMIWFVLGSPVLVQILGHLMSRGK